MSERIKERLRGIAEKEFPGCTVKFRADGQQIQISQNGRVISNHAPPAGWKFADFDGQTDDQLRTFVRAICAA